MSRSPFLSLGLVCLAALCPPILHAQQASATPAGNVTPPTTDPAPRKVWTNEDVPTLREDSTISTIGTRPASGTVHKAASSRQDAKWYSDQITKLQAQLPAINGKIAQLQAGIDGKFTGDSQSSTRPKSATFGNWQIELAQLQKQRDDIQSRIDALRDQARRQGIPPNALP